HRQLLFALELSAVRKKSPGFCARSHTPPPRRVLLLRPSRSALAKAPQPLCWRVPFFLPSLRPPVRAPFGHPDLTFLLSSERRRQSSAAICIRCVRHSWYALSASGPERVLASLVASPDQRSTSNLMRSSQARLACSHASSSSFCTPSIASVCSFPNLGKGVEESVAFAVITYLRTWFGYVEPSPDGRPII